MSGPAPLEPCFRYDRERIASTRIKALRESGLAARGLGRDEEAIPEKHRVEGLFAPGLQR
jgi:hypothetical protein